jgi:hypothetical protein
MMIFSRLFINQLATPSGELTFSFIQKIESEKCEQIFHFPNKSILAIFVIEVSISIWVGSIV